MLAPVMKELGWHLQLWIDVKDLPDTIPILQSIGAAGGDRPHGPQRRARRHRHAGLPEPAAARSARAAAGSSCRARIAQPRAPDYPDARPFHEALVRANPDQLVWGSDWPHPRIEGEMPDAGHLLDLFTEWTPDEAVRRNILARQSGAALRVSRLGCGLGAARPE